MQYDTLDEMWLAESCHVRLNGSHLGSRQRHVRVLERERKKELQSTPGQIMNRS